VASGDFGDAESVGLVGLGVYYREGDFGLVLEGVGRLVARCWVYIFEPADPMSVKLLMGNTRNQQQEASELHTLARGSL
jgi:hypothetical protein